MKEPCDYQAQPPQCFSGFSVTAHPLTLFSHLEPFPAQCCDEVRQARCPEDKTEEVSYSRRPTVHLQSLSLPGLTLVPALALPHLSHASWPLQTLVLQACSIKCLLKSTSLSHSSASRHLTFLWIQGGPYLYLSEDTVCLV